MLEIEYMEQNKKNPKVKKFFDEFHEFIKRGNVVDLAVAVVVGGAFSTIVTSLVNDIIMPLIGIIIGGINFSSLSLTLGEATINYGKFIQNIINFLIIAFVIFLVLRCVNQIFKKNVNKKEPEKPKKSDEVYLLEEIRDLLKKENK